MTRWASCESADDSARRVISAVVDGPRYALAAVAQRGPRRMTNDRWTLS